MILSDSQFCGSLLVLSANLGFLAERRLGVLLESYGLGPSEYRVLGAVVELGSCTAVEVAALVPTDASFISRMVQRLVGKELLVRRRSLEDRRTVVLRPTDEGVELMAGLARRLRSLEEEFACGVPRCDLDTVRAAIVGLLVYLESEDGR